MKKSLSMILLFALALGLLISSPVHAAEKPIELRWAVEMVMARQFGMMAALHGGEIVPVPLDEALGEANTVSTDRYDVAKLFFG